jgi:tetratricopeptide (TPR) repeat protein
MSGAELPQRTPEPEEILRRLDAVYASVREHPITGDASLDVLLRSIDPPIMRWVQDLSVPHWFDEAIAAALAPEGVGPPAAYRERLLALPFVRVRSHRFAYHDATRAALREALLHSEPARVREICRRVTTVLDAKRTDDTDHEDEGWERAYCMLASDEPAGLVELRRLFVAARQGYRLGACHQLLAMAEEQTTLLSPQGRTTLGFLRALLALDRHEHERAAAELASLDSTIVDGELGGHIELYRGRVLEETERWRDAAEHYSAVLAKLPRANGNSGLLARLHHRLASAEFARGELGSAEEHVRRSIEINEAGHDTFGLALNYGLLGELCRRLGDPKAASANFAKSLEYFERSGRSFERSLVLGNLARLHSDSGRFDEAERAYQQAIELRTASGDSHGLAFIHSDLANVALRRGNLDEALQHFQTAAQIFREFRDQQRLAQVLRATAVTLYNSDRPAEAMERLSEAIALVDRNSDLHRALERDLERYKRKMQYHRLPRWKRWRRHALIVLAVGAAVVVLLLLLGLAVELAGVE